MGKIFQSVGRSLIQAAIVLSIGVILGMGMDTSHFGVFASNALFRITIMPTWLQYVVKVNPVSYANDALRQLR